MDYDDDDNISVSISSCSSDGLDSLSEISIIVSNKTYYDIICEFIKKLFCIKSKE
jgi:hypothetical protein